MTRTFTAQFTTECVTCNGTIHPGDPITWNRRGSKGTSHLACASSSSDLFTAPQPERKPAPLPSPDARYPQPVTPAADPTGLGPMLAALVQPYIQAQSADVDARIDAAIKTALASLTPTTRIEVFNASTQTSVIVDTPQHVLFARLLDLIQLGFNVYLWGDSGSGKSTAAINAADALGMSHGYISLSAQTAESRIMGFMNAQGEYVETEFYRCYKNGGVFCIDEMDNASANLLTALNGALENGSCAFPCGMIARHPKFVLIATGNTPALGANPMFPDRRPLDGAFRRRFLFVEWNTDTKLEQTLALAQNPDATQWVIWVQKLRAWSKTNMPRLLVTADASIKGAQLLATGRYTAAEVAEMVTFKGFDRDSVAKTIAANPLPRI